MEKISYSSPEVEIIQTDVQCIICQSGGTEQFYEGDTNNWFN